MRQAACIREAAGTVKNSGHQHVRYWGLLDFQKNKKCSSLTFNDATLDGPSGVIYVFTDDMGDSNGNPEGSPTISRMAATVDYIQRLNAENKRFLYDSHVNFSHPQKLPPDQGMEDLAQDLADDLRITVLMRWETAGRCLNHAAGIIFQQAIMGYLNRVYLQRKEATTGS